MTDYVRMIAWGGAAGAILGAAVFAPAALSAAADEPVRVVAATVEQLFSKDTIDPKVFRRYDITLDDSVSTEVQSVRTVTKIGFGRMSTVSIVTTPTGTYSSDGLLSPHVRYPGIEVSAKRRPVVELWSSDRGGRWLSITNGSFTTIQYVPNPATRT